MTAMGEKVLKKLDAIVNRTTEKYRKALNQNIHALDVSYRAMLNSIPENYSEEEFLIDYEHFVTILKSGLRPAKSLSATIKFIKGKEKPGVFLVDDKEFGMFVVGISFESVQRTVSSLMRQQKNTSYFTRFNQQGSTLNNVGHAPTEAVGAIGQSPLKLKLLDMLKLIPSNPAIISALDKLHSTHAFSTTYSMERPDIDITRLNRALGKVTVLVTIQSWEKNNELSIIEKSIEAEVKKYISSPEFRNGVINAKGSNSIKEDLLELIKQEITGKKVGVPKHTKKPKEVKNSTIKAESKIAPATKPQRMPRLRSAFDNKVISLVSIQQLINRRLADQIQLNMGKGKAKSILNYRSGRFADSVRVERLARSKEDEITAFYTYMKYPYQTFEPGFKQGNIPTRDPKILISKSMREIAKELVTARLKAVLV